MWYWPLAETLETWDGSITSRAEASPAWALDELTVDHIRRHRIHGDGH